MLNDKTLKTALESGALLPVYLIEGDDIYLKKQALDRIIKATIQPDDALNLTRYEYGVDMQEVYDELNGFPVMSDKKCVVLSDFDIEDASKSDFEKLCELTSEPYDTAVFVLFFGTYELDTKKSQRAKQLISAVESAGGDIVRLNHKSQGELIRWLTASAKKRGITLSPQNAGYIIETCSQDINQLSAELNKLCAYQKQGEITREIIDKVCVKSVDASVYDLASKIIAGDTAGAMKLLDELYYMNIQTNSIFYNIASCFVDMYRALAAKLAGKDPQSLGADFGMGSRSFLLGRAAGNLRKYDAHKLELSFDELVSTEKEIKSISIGQRAAIEKLIIRLIYIMKTGEALD